jgi:hypothetical protein
MLKIHYSVPGPFKSTLYPDNIFHLKLMLYLPPSQTFVFYASFLSSPDLITLTW